RATDRAVRGGPGRRRFRAAALSLPDAADDAADPDGGGDVAGDGPAEADRHRLCHDWRRAGPSVGDDQSLQLSGGVLLRQDRLRLGHRPGAVRDRDRLHAGADPPAQARRVSPQRRRRLGFAVAGWSVTLVLVAPFLWMVLGSFKTT